jgi:hypothetical protein
MFRIRLVLQRSSCNLLFLGMYWTFCFSILKEKKEYTERRRVQQLCTYSRSSLLLQLIIQE